MIAYGHNNNNNDNNKIYECCTILAIQTVTAELASFESITWHTWFTRAQSIRVIGGSSLKRALRHVLNE